MNSPTIDYRLAKLEKENRFFRKVVFGILLTIGAFSLMSFADQQDPADAHFRIVYASKFSLRDQRTGKVRAELSHQTMEGGWAGITLWDNDGRPRAEFKLWEDGRTRFAMMDEKRNELSNISVSPEGEAKFHIASSPAK